MKFMKLGSKPDSFQTDEENARYVANELATDITIIVADMKFYLHKFPLLSKCSHLQKLIATGNDDNAIEFNISDIPGGPSTFELCAKFCYGMTVTLNAYNVVAARCAAEYLGMNETVEKGNLIYKIEVFLNSSIFHSWKDSIIVLQTTKSMLPMSEELKTVSRCIEAIATKACIDYSQVDWSYTYNRKKLPEENGSDPNLNGVRNRAVPRDWWVEDLCELNTDLYKRVITSIKSKAILSSELIGEALKAYAYRRLQGFRKGVIQGGDQEIYRVTVDTIVGLLPAEKNIVSCSFLLKLLKAAILLDLSEMAKKGLVKRIGQQLDEASVSDLLIQSPEGDVTIYDVDTVLKIVEEFLVQDKNNEIEPKEDASEFQEIRRPGILSEASKLMVAKLMDSYLAEVAKDPNLPSSKFLDLAEMLSGINRPAHDGLYRAIDMYLKEHPGIGKSDRKKICKLMDCKKLSVDACMHAVQNERLPMRVIVQVLFFEQVRTSASSGSSTPDLPKCIKDINNGSLGSARSATTHTVEDWDAMGTAEELKALKEELQSLKLAAGGGNDRNGGNYRTSTEKAVVSKLKGLLKSKRTFKKLWSNKGGQGNNSRSDSSESLDSANPEDAKSTPSRTRRRSVS